MRLFIWWIALLLISITPGFSWARGGGGCLMEGTEVLTPNGSNAIENLKEGESVWSVTEGKLEKGKVRALTKVRPEEYIEVCTDRTKLEVTSEHPMMVARGEYRPAGLLRVGDTVYLAEKGRLEASKVESVRRIVAKGPAFNLLVSPGGTFIAGGFVVHNKGCFLPESPILKADGTESAISAVKPGEELLAFTPEGRMVRTKVREIIDHEVDEYVLLKTERVTLRVTLEHPFYIGRGTFKTVEALREGDALFAWDGSWFSEQRIISLERVYERVQVFNLQTDQPNTFFAGRIAVHNKGGCFPAGTKIGTPNGPVAIETLTAGDEVLGVTPGGLTVRTPVESIFISRSPLLRIKTDRGVLMATEEHPVSLWGGRFGRVGDLRRGDRIVKWKAGRLVAGNVRQVSDGAAEGLVFNLQVGEPHTFVAEGIVVHNKGGGSFHSGSGSSSGGGSSSEGALAAFIVTIVFITGIVLLIFVLSKRKGSSKSENLDYVYSQDKVAPKAEKTEKLLAFLSQQDHAVSPEELRKLADSTFRKLQECWQAREYGPMESLLMPDLYAQHTAQLQGLSRNHEINRIEGLKVERVDLINVRYAEKPEQREFTVLISAWARDYYVDDRTEKFLRGDEALARFQEFWTFHRVGDRWLLREIDQAGESDMLKEENFVEMLTDDTIKGIYGERVAKKRGVAGPWLEKGTEEKATRIDRMLNFLVQTDKLWDRSGMLERARQVFLSVYLARESGEAEKVPVQDLFSKVAGSLQEQIHHWQSEGLKVEYRNLCVRKVELILLRNFADRTRDEFTVRISAHAQRITRKADQVVSEQQYVTPFEEYWTFGRLEEQWKLKEVLPPALGKRKITEENVDEDSSSGQLQWYYRQTRAV